MDHPLPITPCVLLTWALMAVGALSFALIATAMFPARLGGVSLVTFNAGCLLYIRMIVKCERREQAAAFALGRLSTEGGVVRPLR